MRVVWRVQDDGSTVRKLVCPSAGCDYTHTPSKMDHKVHTILSLGDAQALRDVLHTAQNALDTAVIGHEEAHRGWMTLLQQRINMIPEKLRFKIERDGA